MATLSLKLREGTITLRRELPFVSQAERTKNCRLYASAITEIDEKHKGLKIMHWTRHVIANVKCVFGESDGAEPTEEQLEDVYIKISRHSAQVSMLENEAEFYVHHLMHLQGKIVPEFYGFFVGKGRDGHVISCTLLEKIDGSGPVMLREFARLVIYYACQVHQAGLHHGHLYDKRHIVPSNDMKIRIVDFTDAQFHTCKATYPIVAESEAIRPVGCLELELLEVDHCRNTRSELNMRRYF